MRALRGFESRRRDAERGLDASSNTPQHQPTTECIQLNTLWHFMLGQRARHTFKLMPLWYCNTAAWTTFQNLLSLLSIRKRSWCTETKNMRLDSKIRSFSKKENWIFVLNYVTVFFYISNCTSNSMQISKCINKKSHILHTNYLCFVNFKVDICILSEVCRNLTIFIV